MLRLFFIVALFCICDSARCEKIHLDSALYVLLDNNGIEKSITGYANFNDTLPVLFPDSLSNIYDVQATRIGNINIVVVHTWKELYRFHNKKKRSNLLLFFRVTRHPQLNISGNVLELCKLHLDQKMKRKKQFAYLVHARIQLPEQS